MFRAPGTYSIGRASKNHAKLRSRIQNPSYERQKMALDVFGIFALFCKNTTSVLATQDVCCGKKRCLLWQDKMCVLPRQDMCCGKTRCVLWQDKISVVARHKGGGLRPPPQRGGGLRPPPLLCGYLYGWVSGGWVCKEEIPPWELKFPPWEL